MSWWKKTKIPIDDKSFIRIFNFFVLECPSSRKRGGGNDKRGNKKPIEYEDVSNRGTPFRKRNISGNLLTTILAEIRRPLAKQGNYVPLDKDGSVENSVKQILSDSSLKDPNFDLITYRRRSEMSDTEAIYYYIRNAFAHGSFDVQNIDGKNVYRFESRKNSDIYAQMRLKESTLNRLIELAKLDQGDVKRLQKPRTRKK